MPLELADIDEVWPRVEHVARVSINGDQCSHEELKIACREGQALCFASPDGVLVVTLEQNHVKMDLELLIWVAASVGTHGVIQKYLPQIDQIARELGVSRMKFESDRAGWLRALGGDWRIRNIEFERDVPSGE